MQKIYFFILGMHCSSCASRLEHIFTQIHGVSTATVNIASSLATITPDPAIDRKTLIATIIQQAKHAGFEAQILDQESTGVAWEQKQNQEAAYIDMLKYSLIPEILCTLFIVTISMGYMLPLPLPDFFNPHINPLNNALTQLIVTIPVIISGRHFYIEGLPKLWHMQPDMNSLVALGTGASFLYSLVSTIQLFYTTKTPELYYESTAVLITLISLGKYFEASSKFHMSDAIRKLIKLTPKKALRISTANQHHTFEEINNSDIQIGDLLLVHPGTTIPTDGIIVQGSSDINTSIFTGESYPTPVAIGDPVIGGTTNISGPLTIQVQRIGADTMLANIIKLVRDAQASKAPIARIADSISLFFVPFVICVAIVSSISWLFFGGLSYAEAISIFTAVLVISCPCALGIATPISIMMATSRGAQLGVLIKNGSALEYAGNINTLVFDKTGTLTEGTPQLTQIIPLNTLNNEDILQIAASLEINSKHPFAQAITTASQQQNLPYHPVNNVVTYQGLGIKGDMDLNGSIHTITIGTQTFLEQQRIHFNDNIYLHQKLQKSIAEHATIGFMAMDTTLVAIFAVTDPIRQEAHSIIQALKKIGLTIIMLSGDTQHVAKAVAQKLTINLVIANVLPDDKKNVIQNIQKEKKLVGMVGDGVNDAPALAQADVGIAMGSGMDIAIESSDIVLLHTKNSHEPLKHVVTAILLSRATIANIHQNLFWAFSYNSICIPIAAGALKLFGGPLLSPMIAGIAMALSSLSVVVNALRLKTFKPYKK